MFTLCLLTRTAVYGDGFELGVIVEVVTPNEGQVVVSLYDEKKSWLKEPSMTAKGKVEDGESVQLRFPGLPAGSYAFTVFYDQDGNGEMATGMFGIPKEPVAFSKNARGKFGPAKWKKTNFLLEQDMTMSVTVVSATD